MHYNILWSVASAHRYNSVLTFQPTHARQTPSVNHQTIIVLDFGSQYTQLIARRLRELSVYSEIWPPDTPAARFAPATRPASSCPAARKACRIPAHRMRSGALRLGRPVLGICYGMQLMAHDARRARSRRRRSASSGMPPCRWRPRRPAALFADVPEEIRVWASHGDFVAAAPSGFTVVATSANAPVAAMANAERRLYALLFHPEVVQPRAVSRFCAISPAGLRLHWRLDDGVVCRRGDREDSPAGGTRRVVCGLSGGVDSTVAALIIHRAIGDRLTCIFVDNGVLRLDEAAQIRARFERLACRCASWTPRSCSSTGSRGSPTPSRNAK